jgi:hypothetical protein
VLQQPKQNEKRKKVPSDEKDKVAANAVVPLAAGQLLGATVVQTAVFSTLSAAEQVDGAKIMFAKYDADDSGTIDASELTSLFSDLGMSQVSDESLAAYDLDKNGTLDFGEFAAMYNDVIFKTTGADGETPEPLVVNLMF